jgi:hypothetical protein
VLATYEDIFIYLVINRSQGNLGLSRRKIDEIEKRLELAVPPPCERRCTARTTRHLG